MVTLVIIMTVQTVMQLTVCPICYILFRLSIQHVSEPS